MTEWKQNGKYPDSMFGLNFREDYPDIAKELSHPESLQKGKVALYDFTKSHTKDGYTYKAKQVTSSKNGKTYVFVERFKAALGDDSQEQIAHEAVKKEYQDGAKKGHEENVQMHKERMEMEQKRLELDRITLTAITNLNESVVALLEELRLRAGDKKE